MSIYGYTYPITMYRTDGYSQVCNQDSDVANLPTPQGSSWASQPWIPSNFNSGNFQGDYATLQATAEAQAAQITALQAEIISANQALTGTGL
jgi:hypothetical protein